MIHTDFAGFIVLVLPKEISARCKKHFTRRLELVFKTRKFPCAMFLNYFHYNILNKALRELNVFSKFNLMASKGKIKIGNVSQIRTGHFFLEDIPVINPYSIDMQLKFFHILQS